MSQPNETTRNNAHPFVVILLLLIASILFPIWKRVEILSKAPRDTIEAHVAGRDGETFTIRVERIPEETDSEIWKRIGSLIKEKP